MDVLQETSLAVPAQNPTQINGVDEREPHDHGVYLKLYVAADAAVPLSSPAAAANAQKGSQEGQGAVLSPPSSLNLNEVPENNVPDESSTHAISLTCCATKGVSPWSLPEDCDKTPFNMMVPGGISTLTGDCLSQPSRTCLGCFIETKDTADPADPEPGISLKMGDMSQGYDSCSIPDMSMQCMSSGDNSRYDDKVLSDHLLSYPVHKARVSEKRDAENPDSDSEDPTSKGLYEGLLLDKCNGEEALLANPSQDWGCFESFISESKIELLDLCSKNELSVNLFSEEDVDNYMFDDDDDSTLSSDVCSLKIRYESFQDNVREKTNALQEEAQFTFFPSVLTNCAKKESGAIRKSTEGLQLKGDEISLWSTEEKGDKGSLSADSTQDVSSESQDSNNLTEDSGEYSDDSFCTGSSYDTLREAKGSRHFLSRENSSSSSQLNYGLRAKRKVRYSEDYLYDVDSIENERNIEKREKQQAGSKEEDDDWCPKKRRKSSRKEPPVIIKYIIINRFKGEKHMLVKIGKVNPTDLPVSINEDSLNQYKKLAPLKEYWQKRQQEKQGRKRLAAGDKHKYRMHGCRRCFRSSPLKRKYKIANSLRIQRIQTVEQSTNKQGSSSSDHKQEGGSEDEAVVAGIPLSIAASNLASRLDQSGIMHTDTRNNRSQEREYKRTGNKIVRIRKFKSEARLRSKKMKDMQEDCKSMTTLTGICPVLENHNSDLNATTIDSAASSPHLCEKYTANPNEKSTFISAICSLEKNVPSVNMDASVLFVPGGYLQTLLDASESSSSTGISYFPHQHPKHYQLSVSQDEKQSASLQLAQSCVLSPPSESELQHSPQNCTNHLKPNFAHMWQSLSSPKQPPFTPDMAESPILPRNVSDPVPVPMADNVSISGYSQGSLDGNRLVCENNYISVQPLQPDAGYQVCQAPTGEGQSQFQRGTLNTDNGRLVSFDSVGSLSATSSSYRSLSLQSCEKDGDDDMNDNFLVHCSPKVVIQQSIEEITPLRESTDLLDISNFTPDKFRHTSLSEMSPPDTPNLSPQVTGPETMGGGKANDFQDTGKVALGSTAEMKWDCSVIPQQVQHGRAFTINSHQFQFQFHTFNDDDDSVGLVEKNTSLDDFDEQANSVISGAKGPKSKKKIGKQNYAPQQKGAKKTKALRAAKGEKSKKPRQSSRSAKKIKPLLDERAAKGQAVSTKTPPKVENNISTADSMTMGGSLTRLSGDWPLLKESDNFLDDDQREFEEPSNILSNIASGMAEVQRFMMASIEPLWDPGSGVCLPPEVNSLKLKTLKILAGTPPDSKKKVACATNPGATRGRKSNGRGGKNLAKLNSSHPSFPPVALDCNMFDRPILGIPGTNGPPHKKMYRHKTSTKFSRDENSKGKRADQNNNLALMASFENLR